MDQTLRFLQQENSRLQDETRRLTDELNLLRDYVSALSWLESAADQLTHKQDLFGLLDRILYYALTVLDASEGSIVLVDEETDELVFSVVRGAIQSTLVNYRMPKTEGITGWVVTHRQPAIVNQVRLDERFSPLVDELFHFTTRSMACVPMKLGPRVLGTISVLNKHGGADFGEIDQRLLSILGWIAAVVLTRYDECDA